MHGEREIWSMLVPYSRAHGEKQRTLHCLLYISHTWIFYFYFFPLSLLFTKSYTENTLNRLWIRYTNVEMPSVIYRLLTKPSLYRIYIYIYIQSSDFRPIFKTSRSVISAGLERERFYFFFHAEERIAVRSRERAL